MSPSRDDQKIRRDIKDREVRQVLVDSENLKKSKSESFSIRLTKQINDSNDGP